MTLTLAKLNAKARDWKNWWVIVAGAAVIVAARKTIGSIFHREAPSAKEIRLAEKKRQAAIRRKLRGLE